MIDSDWNFAVLDVLKVVDGDTVDLRVDLGFHVSASLRFRLARIDAPEMSSPEGPVVKQYVADWLDHQLLRVTSKKIDNYGRWLGDITRADGQNLSDDLLSSGRAVPWPAVR